MIARVPSCICLAEPGLAQAVQGHRVVGHQPEGGLEGRPQRVGPRATRECPPPDDDFLVVVGHDAERWVTGDDGVPQGQLDVRGIRVVRQGLVIGDDRRRVTARRQRRARRLEGGEVLRLVRLKLATTSSMVLRRAAAFLSSGQAHGSPRRPAAGVVEPPLLQGGVRHGQQLGVGGLHLLEPPSLRTSRCTGRRPGSSGIMAAAWSRRSSRRLVHELALAGSAPPRRAARRTASVSWRGRRRRRSCSSAFFRFRRRSSGVSLITFAAANSRAAIGEPAPGERRLPRLQPGGVVLPSFRVSASLAQEGHRILRACGSLPAHV